MFGVGGIGVILLLSLYVVFWAAIVFGVAYFAVRLALKNTPLREQPGSDTRDALGILRERYARGELSRDEYQRMRRDLE